MSIRNHLWVRCGICLISCRAPEDLTKAVRDKVVAITWTETLCSLLSFSFFFAIEFDGISSASLFRDVPYQILSLEGSLLLKGTSGFFVCLSLAHHIRVKDFISLIACNSICPTLDDPHSVMSGRGRILSSLEKSSTCIAFTKAVDFIVGVVVWFSLLSAHSKTGFDAPKDVTTLLGMIVCTQIFTSIISPILYLAAAW